jgi:hypothetical protein
MIKLNTKNHVKDDVMFNNNLQRIEVLNDVVEYTVNGVTTIISDNVSDNVCKNIRGNIRVNVRRNVWENILDDVRNTWR